MGNTPRPESPSEKEKTFSINPKNNSESGSNMELSRERAIDGYKLWLTTEMAESLGMKDIPGLDLDSEGHAIKFHKENAPSLEELEKLCEKRLTGLTDQAETIQKKLSKLRKIQERPIDDAKVVEFVRKEQEHYQEEITNKRLKREREEGLEVEGIPHLRGMAELLSFKGYFNNFTRELDRRSPYKDLLPKEEEVTISEHDFTGKKGPNGWEFINNYNGYKFRRSENGSHGNIKLSIYNNPDPVCTTAERDGMEFFIKLDFEQRGDRTSHHNHDHDPETFVKNDKKPNRTMCLMIGRNGDNRIYEHLNSARSSAEFLPEDMNLVTKFVEQAFSDMKEIRAEIVKNKTVKSK